MTNKFKGLLFIFSNIIRKASQYAINIYFARYFSLEIFGEYSSLYQVSTFLVILTNLGFHEYILVNKDRGVDKEFFTLILCFSAITLLALILFVSPLLGKTSAIILFVLTMIKAYVDNSLNNIVVSYFQVKRDLWSMIKINMALIIGSIITVISCFLWNFTIINALFILTLSSILPFIIFIALYCDLNMNDISIQSIIQIPCKVKDYAFSTITVPIYMSIPNLIASIYFNKESMAIFQVTLSLGNIVLLTAMSIIQSNYSKYLHARNLKSVLNNDIWKFIIGFILIFLSWLFLGKHLINMLYKKNELLPVYYWVLYLLVGYLFLCIGAILNVFFVLAKKQKLIFQINIELIIGGVILSLFLSRLGILGIITTINIVYFYSFLRRVVSLPRINFHL